MTKSNLFQSRDYYKPFHYNWAFKAYETQQKLHWLPSQAPLHKDVEDWQQRLTEGERNLLTQLFRFFTQGDVDVASAYRDRYMPLFKHPELSMFLFAAGASEANHVHSYSLLLDTIGMPETEYKAFHDFEQMKAKHEYLFGHRGNNLSDTGKIALDIAVFSAFSEGMQLFSSFAILMSFQSRGLMNGMTTIVEWSIRDESHHVETMTELFHTLLAENPEVWNDELKGAIYQTAVEMVDLEDHFIDLAFSMGAIKGLTPEEVKLYIRWICDRRLNALGLKDKFGVKSNPLVWLNWIMNAQTHANFFEQRSTEYSKGAVAGWDKAYAPVLDEQTTFILYTKPDCPHCDRAKATLGRFGTPHSVVLLETPEERERFHHRYGTKSMPQIFLAGGVTVAQRVGGADELEDFLKG